MLINTQIYDKIVTDLPNFAYGRPKLLTRRGLGRNTRIAQARALLWLRATFFAAIPYRAFRAVISRLVMKSLGVVPAGSAATIFR